jgi:hypothetical protein
MPTASPARKKPREIRDDWAAEFPNSTLFHAGYLGHLFSPRECYGLGHMKGRRIESQGHAMSNGVTTPPAGKPSGPGPSGGLDIHPSLASKAAFVV